MNPNNADVHEVLENTAEILQNPTQILEVEPSKIDEALQTLIQAGVNFGMKLLVAILILVAGVWLSNKITRSIKKVMQLRDFDPSLQSFLGSFINVLLKTFVFIIVLTTVGVQMTSIVAVLGAASLAIGLALQGTLQNFAGGVIILMLKPFHVDDIIETASGKIGVVKKIMMFTTELHTFDNQVVFLPNGALANGIITNMSHEKNRRTDLSISISYGDNVDAARKAILDVLKKDKRILQTRMGSNEHTDKWNKCGNNVKRKVDSVSNDIKFNDESYTCIWKWNRVHECNEGTNWRNELNRNREWKDSIL